MGGFIIRGRGLEDQLLCIEPLIAARLQGCDRLHFDPEVAKTAIGAIPLRALHRVLEEHPGVFPVMFLESWNARARDINREMMVTKEMCHADTKQGMMIAVL